MILLIVIISLILLSTVFISGECEKDYCEKCSLQYNCEAYQASNPKICQYFEPEN